MKASYRNYFKGGKLYQWDKNKEIFTITNTEIQEEFCLDQKSMELFMKFDNPEIKIDGKLKVKSGKLKSNINITEEELIVPNLEFTSTFKSNIDKLKLASKFVSDNTAKVMLTGVNISNNHIQATDSFFSYRSACENDCEIIISKCFIDALSNYKGELEFKANNNLIACEIDNTMIIGRLIAGAYPNLERLYKDKPINAIEIEKKELKDLAQISNEKNAIITFEKDKITISGENEVELELNLPIECKISFALDKLLSIVNCIELSNLKINYSDESHPVYINDEYLLLPVRRN